MHSSPHTLKKVENILSQKQDAGQRSVSHLSGTEAGQGRLLSAKKCFIINVKCEEQEPRDGDWG